MAITDYSSLAAALVDYMGDNAYTTSQAQLDISLAEARLNRELKSVKSYAELTGTEDVATIDVADYNVISPIGLYLTTYDEDDEIVFVPQGTLMYSDDSSYPARYTLIANNDTLRFNSPLDEAYTFRFEYVGRFALSESVTTNQLLTDHPDVYFAAALMWGAAKNQDIELAASYKTLLDGFIAETRNYLAQANRGVLTVDRGLLGLGSGAYNIESDV